MHYIKIQNSTSTAQTVSVTVG